MPLTRTDKVKMDKLKESVDNVDSQLKFITNKVLKIDSIEAQIDGKFMEIMKVYIT